MVDNAKYAEDYLNASIRQERIMQKQMKRALNAFVFQYARVYQNSAINFAEIQLRKDHAIRVQKILETRYKFIIPFFSKFYLNGFIDDITKAEGDILIDQQDRVVSRYIMTAQSKAIGISKTSLRSIRFAIDNGVKEGLSITEIASNIRGVTKVNSRRAETIARTEVHGASNYAAIETAKSAEQELGLTMQKEWIATVDGRTRDTHIALNGTTVDMNDNFNVNGSLATRPLDPSLPAGELINCRCTMAFKRKEYDIE